MVPERAGRSPWLAALWTGFGAAVVCALIAIVLVAICWLPVSGDAGATNGRTTSAIRAGLLTFLAAVHGGITVDGVSVAWLPLGMLLLVGLVARRAGHGLADAAHALGECDPLRLALVAGAQTVTFAVAALVAIPFATLGTSRAPFLGVGVGALLVFGVFGGTAFVRATPLREAAVARISPDARAALRAAVAAVGVYLIAGIVLVAGSLVVHHDTVARLMSSVGGGWGAVPVLLLCVLALPNAAIAGAAYLLGPGFAVGSGAHAGLFGSTHGVVPAFPLLGALPTGAGGNPVALACAVLTLLAAGFVVARSALRADGWAHRVARLVGSSVAAALIMLVSAWQAGGALGDARLHTVGPSPLLVCGAMAAAVCGAGLVLGALLAGARVLWRGIGFGGDEDDDESSFADLLTTQLRPRLVHSARLARAEHDDGDEADRAAG